MRGAALKLGQFLAIQGRVLFSSSQKLQSTLSRLSNSRPYTCCEPYTDAKILPPQIEEVLVKVQCTADYMPFEQAEVSLIFPTGHNA